jgi:hypothetical protein
MFSACGDQQAGVLVGVYAGHVDTAEDYQACLRAIVDADAAAVRGHVPFACLLVTGTETSAPPPRWRQRMATTNSEVLSPTYYFALVSPSLVIRGVFTAVQWLTRLREGHQHAVFPTFEAASRWIRDNAKRDYPQLESLYARARSSQTPATTTESRLP